ncbi:MAG: glycerol acyltransferase, partial [Bacteroidales bacterium]
MAKKKLLEKVDVREAFSSKNPRVARLIPGFVYWYIKRIVHQNEMNDFLKAHGKKTGIDFINAVIEDFNVSIIVKGEGNIPKQGRLQFVANHPLGGFDGMILMHIISRYFKNIKFLVNDILMNILNIEELFVPVNTFGKQSVEYARRIDNEYASDSQILNFPAGICSRKIKGRILDLEWKKSFINKSVQHKRDIVPVHFGGRNSNFFYNLSNIRKALGIKTNIELFFLADEMYRQKNKTVSVKFGELISYKTFDKSKNHQEWAKYVKDKVYALGDV